MSKLEDVTRDCCTCGGGGPDDPHTCPACMVWHRMQRAQDFADARQTGYTRTLTQMALMAPVVEAAVAEAAHHHRKVNMVGRLPKECSCAICAAVRAYKEATDEG